MKAKTFLALQTPLLVSLHGFPERCVLLAFVVSDNDDLGGLIVSPTGGRATFEPIDRIDFPAPIVPGGPVLGTVSNREQRRHS